MSDRVAVDYCKHTIPVYAVEEMCASACHQRATHKVEETSGPTSFHPLTAYLCCGCFMAIVGYDCSTYPYDIDEKRSVPFIAIGNNEPIPDSLPEELKQLLREKRGEA